MFRDKAWVEFARWNAISRVEVDRQGNNGKAIVIDADASTYIMNVDPHAWQGTEWQKNLMSAPPALANVLRPHGEYAIIGPGGGVDVLRAVANGSPSVTGIEINPIIANTIMRGRYADYSYHLYERPEVHMHVTDGRSFVRNADQQFDVVQMTLVDTWASTAAGAFALSENSLYTVDAFREYFEHLKPDGMIAITRWEFQRAARGACAWSRSRWKPCISWASPNPAGTSSWSPKAISTKTAFRSSCWPRRAPSRPKKKQPFGPTWRRIRRSGCALSAVAARTTIRSRADRAATIPARLRARVMPTTSRRSTTTRRSSSSPSRLDQILHDGSVCSAASTGR